MEKQTITNKRLGEEYFSYTHPSGLRIALYPMQGYSTAYTLFATNFGSVDASFKLEGDTAFTSVPDGIAHFLEHKMFENEEGDAFLRFSETGASANAFTTFDKTAYLFSCSEHFYESFEILLDFVQRPYFTDQSVAKEQGIIGQEIKMYQDDPGWMVFFGLLQGLYSSNPVRIDTAGSVDSIAQIDPAILHRCHEVFYHPSNMTLTVAGDFDPQKVIEMVERMIPVTQQRQIVRGDFEEPREVACAYKEISLPVAAPMFAIGYKQDPPAEADRIRDYVLDSFCVECVVGECTPFYQQMYEQGLINSTFDSDVFMGREYLSAIYEGESHQPKEVFERLRAAYREAATKGIDPALFENVRKSFYGKNIKSFNNVQSVASALVDASFYEYSVFEIIEQIAAVSLGDVNAFLRAQFDPERMVLSVVNPAEE